LKSSSETGRPTAANSSNNALAFCINCTDSSPCWRSWREPWSCIIQELDVEARPCSSVHQTEHEVWQSTTKWKLPWITKKVEHLEWVSSVVSNKERSDLLEERYHQQQEHAERGRSLRHQQS
jgi:hypothetical protein